MQASVRIGPAFFYHLSNRLAYQHWIVNIFLDNFFKVI
ncbi:hypothetical protein AN619_23200 [Thermotalea metallivorans]|uniref:Uncharacterized protein n=1 Tax=Thermotalea metallivorans TaxID=520762 RepID=A0A140L1S4_9FIRM|nr:hypothetical protein AN619_23200 [Thermotalea metallivorans]